MSIAGHNAVETNPPVHPSGRNARVLLTSVFGPYAQDDEFGSRRINPMELYHNQVTRTQGPFSLRMFHRSWGIMLIQCNISAPCALLDFPTLDRFVEEIRSNQYDVVGITSILPNLGKVREMCRLIRKYLPQAKIVVGGHISNAPDISERIDADYIARGDGVEWFRRFLGEDVSQPIRHPLIPSGINTRTMGLNVRRKKGEVAATLIPSVGCPMGCNFCATSAMFGGKGKFINFYETGDELFHVMCGLEKEMEIRSFFVMDENFLLHKKRALRVLELMEEYGKSWSLYVFSSARVLLSYDIEQLVGLGISWAWMGLEGKQSQYVKLSDVNTFDLVKHFHAHGIRLLGSSIIGLEEHTPENIHEAIEYAVSHDTDFHQFMLYTPIPGTPLYADLKAKQNLLPPEEFDEADIHGQYIFNYRHPHFQKGQETEFLIHAFERDFEVNGPSVLRIARTTLEGWKRYKHHPSKRIRDRFAYEAHELYLKYAGSLWAAKRWFNKNLKLVERISTVLEDVKREFGLKARLMTPIVGRVILHKIRKEDEFLKSGGTYEPPVFYELNQQMIALKQKVRAGFQPVKWISPLLNRV
ncbi:MAG: cobalamin B12-binding domain-containing protein [Candidatus Omnitrophica bacterium]|nr:cobalamin B12-binding domain-containing protein [Candidatus Omnitrophota bacterium]